MKHKARGKEDGGDRGGVRASAGAGGGSVRVIICEIQ